MNTAILAPGAALVLWTLVMLGWMMAVRGPAMKRAQVDLNAPTGRRGQDAEAALPYRSNWPAHNYAHLHEQPTLFYAVIGILAITGGATDFDIALAWVYVGFRVIHSVVQSTTNRIALRLPLFLLSALMLLVLAVNALRAAL